MTELRLAQSDENVRPGWWQWSVWLDGTPEWLDRVAGVTYFLHATFSDPVRVVDDRASSFRLSSAGWGEFTIRAEARLRDGTTRRLTHALKLRHTASAEARTASPAPSARGTSTSQVFLSHSAIDGRLAGQVSRELELRGMKVTSSANTMSQRNARSDVTREALQHSDAVIALQSDTPSNAVDDELSAAHGLQKPIVHVRVGPPADKDAPPSDSVLQFGSNARAETIAKQLIERLQPKTGAPGPGDTLSGKPRAGKPRKGR
jgi:transcription initiation factor IIF auxiliary subunit